MLFEMSGKLLDFPGHFRTRDFSRGAGKSRMQPAEITLAEPLTRPFATELIAAPRKKAVNWRVKLIFSGWIFNTVGRSGLFWRNARWAS
jgi:hypothetical protein